MIRPHLLDIGDDLDPSGLLSPEERDELIDAIVAALRDDPSVDSVEFAYGDGRTFVDDVGYPVGIANICAWYDEPEDLRMVIPEEEPMYRATRRAMFPGES